jgi:hypothetical protein
MARLEGFAEAKIERRRPYGRTTSASAIRIRGD